MSDSELLFEKRDGVAYLTFNRPAVHNALNNAMVEGLEKALAGIESDPGVRVVILTGAGEKSFLAGSDIKEISTRTPLEGVENSRRRQGALTRLERLPVPSIAAINGYAFGVGCEIAMSCTLRVASARAKLGQLEINLGIVPGAGGTQRLPRLIGKGKALELILTGKIIDAEESLRIGLVNAVAQPGDLVDECEKLAGVLKEKSPVALKYALRAVNEGLDTDIDTCFKLEGLCLAACLSSDDSKEGLAAFIEKRKPRFTGK